MGANLGTTSASGVVNLYHHYMSPIDANWVRSGTILEIGIGATNSSSYEMAARGAAKCYAFEPFLPLNRPLDERLLQQCASVHNVEPHTLADRVVRLTGTSGLASESINFIVSNSVLEHVVDLDDLAAELRRLLRADGRMLHIVDYRDHFFRFPYHHLLWSRRVWRWFLDPGDLPRWRIGDHIRSFERHGLRVTILKAQSIPNKFAKVSSRIHSQFKHYSAEDLQTAQGVLLANVA